MLKHLFFILISLFFIIPKGICDNQANAFLFENYSIDSVIQNETSTYQDISEILKQDNTNLLEPKHQKLKAVILAVTLGVFGVHRIYLGTDPIIPIAYTLTLGGFGILPIIDIFTILFSKHFDQFKDNKHFFMLLPKKTNQSEE